MDVEAVRSALADSLASCHGAALALGGADHIILADNLMYVVRNGVVVTALPAGNVHDRARALARNDQRDMRA